MAAANFLILKVIEMDLWKMNRLFLGVQKTMSGFIDSINLGYKIGRTGSVVSSF